MTVRILQGDCRDVLRTLPDESVHCVVTSPPYYGLRDYGLPPSIWGGDPTCAHAWVTEGVRALPGAPSARSTLLGNGHVGGGTKAHELRSTASSGSFCQHCNAWRGCLGLEPSAQLYVEHMVAVFRELRRVLREDGTCWLNIGDCFATRAGSVGSRPGGGRRGDRWAEFKGPLTQPNRMPQPGLKPKDLMQVPSRVSLALQDDGWWVRQEIIWHKPSPMPESCTDRPTTSHEKVFLLTKGETYFYDGEAIREGAQLRSSGNLARVPRAERGGPAEHSGGQAGHVPYDSDGSRNARSVWTIPSSPFAGSHFATMPAALAERCMLAGTSEHGCCAACGAPWRRIVEKGAPNLAQQRACGGDAAGAYAGQSTKDHAAAGVQDASAVKARILAGMRERRTVGWQPTCGCGADVVPCTVLDPFLGAGTTALVADRLGRDCVGIELNPGYAAMARRRIEGDAPLLAEVAD